jgi:hypothetical protein
LTFALSDAKHSVPPAAVSGVQIPLAERVGAAVTMTFPSSLAHARRSDPGGKEYNSIPASYTRKALPVRATPSLRFVTKLSLSDVRPRAVWTPLKIGIVTTG